MVDDFRSLRDGLIRALLGSSQTHEDAEKDTDDQSTADARRAILGALFAKAGKGKDEVVQIIGREIGLAIAAMLKEPLSKIADNQKLQISFELVPKEKTRRKAPYGKPKLHTKRHYNRSKK